jgi:hypothetical protein
MTALMDAVVLATAAVPRMYATGAVPATPTYPYGAQSAVMGRGDTYTLDSQTRLRWVRVVGQFFGKTNASVLEHVDKWTAALLDQSLDVAGFRLTPLRMELDPTTPLRDPDDSGVLGVTVTLTATAAKEI